MPLNVGTRLGHYDVTTLLGEGGMGQVFSRPHGAAPSGIGNSVAFE